MTNRQQPLTFADLNDDYFMKITTYSLTVILGFSLALLPLSAQQPDDKSVDNAVEESSEESDEEATTEEGEASEAPPGKTKDEEADVTAEVDGENPEVDEETWEDRLVPSVAVSGLEPAPEIIVGEPSALPGDTAGDKVYLPYPPRARSPLPPGWVLRPSDDLPPMTRKVKLADGRHVILEFPSMEIQPAPAKDGSVSMQEPGFDPRKSAQENTISMVLSEFIEDTTNHRKVLGEALGEMEQILLSAPAAPRRVAPVKDKGEPSSLLLPPSPPTR